MLATVVSNESDSTVETKGLPSITLQDLATKDFASDDEPEDLDYAHNDGETENETEDDAETGDEREAKPPATPSQEPTEVDEKHEADLAMDAEYLRGDLVVPAEVFPPGQLRAGKFLNKPMNIGELPCEDDEAGDEEWRETRSPETSESDSEGEDLEGEQGVDMDEDEVVSDQELTHIVKETQSGEFTKQSLSHKSLRTGTQVKDAHLQDAELELMVSRIQGLLAQAQSHPPQM